MGKSHNDQHLEQKGLFKHRSIPIAGNCLFQVHVQDCVSLMCVGPSENGYRLSSLLCDSTVKYRLPSGPLEQNMYLVFLLLCPSMWMHWTCKGLWKSLDNIFKYKVVITGVWLYVCDAQTSEVTANPSVCSADGGAQRRGTDWAGETRCLLTSC